LTDRHKAKVSLKRHDSNIKEISYRPLQPWGKELYMYTYMYRRIDANVSNDDDDDDDDDVLKKIVCV
jgi:hypothetical protein